MVTSLQVKETLLFNLERLAEKEGMRIESARWEEEVGDVNPNIESSDLLVIHYAGRRHAKAVARAAIEEATYYMGTQDGLERHLWVWLKSL